MEHSLEERDDVRHMFMDRLVDRIAAFNAEHGIENPPTMWNVSYLTLAMAGEVGELANSLKKLLRDGMSDKQRNNVREEIADIGIYLAMIIDALDIDFDEAYLEKEEELRRRFTRIENKNGFPILVNLMKEW